LTSMARVSYSVATDLEPKVVWDALTEFGPRRAELWPDLSPESFKVLESGGTIEYIPGAQQPVGVGGSEKFKLPNEILGYAAVLVRAALHRAGALRWF